MEMYSPIVLEEWLRKTNSDNDRNQLVKAFIYNTIILNLIVSLPNVIRNESSA